MENVCLFCKIIKGEIPSSKIWENEDFYAFLDINPLNAGHALLIPKKHIDYLFDLNDSEYTKIFQNAKMLCSHIKKATNAKRIGIIVEGFSVPHAHIHLVPIFKGNELDPSRAKKANPKDLQETAAKIIAEIGEKA